MSSHVHIRKKGREKEEVELRGLPRTTRPSPGRGVLGMEIHRQGQRSLCTCVCMHVHVCMCTHTGTCMPTHSHTFMEVRGQLSEVISLSVGLGIKFK